MYEFFVKQREYDGYIKDPQNTESAENFNSADKLIYSFREYGSASVSDARNFIADIS